MKRDQVTLRPPQHGVHQWLMRAAWQLRTAGHSESEALFAIRAQEMFLRDGRTFAPDEIENAVAKVFASEIRKRGPKPVKAEPELLKQFMSEHDIPPPKQFAATSPDDPSDLTPHDFLRAAFRPGELVCVGWKRPKGGFGFETLPLDIHLDEPVSGPFVVANPMSAVVGPVLKPDGKTKQSARCKGNQPKVRRFIVTEADSLSRNWQAQVGLIVAIRESFPEAQLALVAHSGGKSLHAWWRVEHLPSDHKSAIFRQAVRLGADPATWSLIQLVRLPGATRENGVAQKIGWVDLDALHG